MSADHTPSLLTTEEADLTRIRSSTSSSSEGQTPMSTPSAVSSATNTPTTKPPWPLWTGEGHLITGSCTVPEWTLINLSTAYLWAPVVGCMHAKPSCCPFAVTPTTSTSVTTTSDASVDATPLIPPSFQSPEPFPVANEPADNTLQRCPDDYTSVSGGCCPRYDQTVK
jgi:hypothetical protein